MRENMDEIIQAIPKQAQRQDATMHQLLDLREVGERLGLHDATDILTTIIISRVEKTRDLIERKG